MFRHINKDLSTLNDCANCRQEREKSLAMEVQKDCDQQWKLVHHLEALEQREQDREIRIALQEDQIQMLQQEVNKLQGKICCCHECPGVTEGPVLTKTTELTKGVENGLEYEDDKAYLTPPTNLQTMLSMDVYHFSLPSSYATLQPIIQSEPEEEQSEVRSCCRTRVVVYADDVIEIADDKRSSSSESSSSDDGVPEDVLELESLLDQENIQPIPIPAPVENLSSRSISACIFHYFYPTLQPSFFHFTSSRFMNNKTRHKTSSYWYKDNKHRLHCTQDGLPQDGLTASSYHLVTNHRTIKGHVELLDSSLCHQLIDQPMLRNHILDLTGFYQLCDNMKPGGSYQMKIGLDIMIQSRTHYLCHLQLSLGCDS